MSYNYQKIVPYLLDWFNYNARILPWRNDPKPYYVWVSEIMLQQTRVEVVKSYFERFTTQLPSIEALANAEEEQILKLWEGLGYYNRVRNMQKAAQKIVAEYDGKMPSQYVDLLQLPGIGTYTAGAIASMAFQMPIPAVDGNVLRIAKRIAGSYDDISKESVKKELWEDIKNIMPCDRPGDFNQAWMDLGATICIPNGKPLCENCPVMHLCNAFKQDITSEIPVKAPKKKRKLEQKTILVIEYEEKFVLHQRAEKGLLAGLWELPGLEGNLSIEKVTKQLSDDGLWIDDISPIGKAKHVFSHIEWHMIGYHVILQKHTDQFMKSKNYQWASKEEIRQFYTLPNAFSAYIKYINNMIK